MPRSNPRPPRRNERPHSKSGRGTASPDQRGQIDSPPGAKKSAPRPPTRGKKPGFSPRGERPDRPAVDDKARPSREYQARPSRGRTTDSRKPDSRKPDSRKPDSRNSNRHSGQDDTQRPASSGNRKFDDKEGLKPGGARFANKKRGQGRAPTRDRHQSGRGPAYPRQSDAKESGQAPRENSRPPYRTAGGKNKSSRGESRNFERELASPIPAAAVIPVLPPAQHYGPTLMNMAKASLAGLTEGYSHAEPLAGLPYGEELKLKNAALQAFWKTHGLPDKPNQVLPSPLPRHYRTTSKRRVIMLHTEVRYDFLPEKHIKGTPRLGANSLLEPKEHAAIYAFILEKLGQDTYRALATSINFVIIRGDYQHFTVFLNVHRLSGLIVRKAKLLTDHLKAEVGLGAQSAYLFFDPSSSPFYLDQKEPQGPWKIKHLYGPEKTRITVGEFTYTFSPISFSQINLSFLPELVSKTIEALKIKPGMRLLDLYCGYGLFSLAAAATTAQVIGIDAASDAIHSAQTMAQARGWKHVRYLQDKLDRKSLTRLLPPAENHPEVILLDPPRQGTAPGLIKELADRKPNRVVQLFCGMDAVPREIETWRRCGYMVAKVIPFDLFPGTDNLEVMVVFVPDKFGLLGRVEKKPLIPGMPYIPRGKNAQNKK